MSDVESNYVKPTPRDFANFVYCGIEWMLDKVEENRKFKERYSQSYDTSPKSKNLKLGQQNEHRCIEWVIKNNHASIQQIIFNGTGNDNYNFLTSTIDSLGIEMQCKPDLVLTKDNQNELYEFKAVGENNYLYMAEFESNHAQIWCYTKIKEIRIDKYFLLRYFIDPFRYTPFYYGSTRLKSIVFSESEELKFQEKFKQYIEAIQLLEKKDCSIWEKLKKEHAQLNECEKRQKCCSCIYGRKKRCPYGDEIDNYINY